MADESWSAGLPVSQTFGLNLWHFGSEGPKTVDLRMFGAKAFPS